MAALAVKSGAQLVHDGMPGLVEAVRQLTMSRVMVGVPDSGAGRKSGPIGNAALAYIHENGAPEANIPPRPFLRPTVVAEKKMIQDSLKRAGRAALAGTSPLPIFNALGLRVASKIKARITAGIPPPLALSTVRGRIRRRRSQTWRAKRTAAVEANVAAGLAPGSGLFTPLIDTGQLRNAITYVVRKVK